MLRTTLGVAVLIILVVGATTILHAAEQPVMTKSLADGDQAPDFVLKDLQGTKVSLGEQLKRGSTVVVVLRGYPGYQCPLCTKQFAELLGRAKEFADAKATVLFIYPGPANDLDKYAKEFVGGKSFPVNYRFLIDPDFAFTNLYGLRWDAPQETAYPSSFILDSNGVIQFAKTSHSHGDRASSDELLAALANANK